MARPIKNNCDYFPHDAGMRNHVKVKALRQKFQNGYSVWVMLLEFITSSDGNVFENSDIQYELLSGDFGVSVTEIRDVVNYCIRLEMLFEKDGFVYSESLNERLAPVYEKRGKAKELSKKQLRTNGKYVSNNTEHHVVSVTEMPQSKVNESKEKEINDFKFLISDYGGTKRGAATELENLKKKHKDWKTVLPLICPAIENQKKYREAKKAKGEFVPEWKNFQTWINQRCWEEVIPTFKEVKKIEYNIVLPDMTGGYKEKV